jgi:hypothetical protein
VSAKTVEMGFCGRHVCMNMSREEQKEDVKIFKNSVRGGEEGKGLRYFP